MVAKKKAKSKPAAKPTFLRPEDRLELLEALNKAKEVCDDSLAIGSACTHIVHDAQHRLNVVASKLGYKYSNETYYGNYTI